jgi:ribosomal protein S18 acetylase RimI-like enzyme
MVPTGVATLGVYVDNDPALAVYRRLGYRTVHTFVSGRTG